MPRVTRSARNRFYHVHISVFVIYVPMVLHVVHIKTLETNRKCGLIIYKIICVLFINNY